MRKITALPLVAVLVAASGTAFAASTVKVSESPGCGTAANNHLCLTLTQAQSNKDVTIRSNSYPSPTTALTLATWAGSITCTITAKTIAVDHFEAEVQVHLQLMSTAKAVEIGGTGGASVGFKVTQPVNFIHGETTPVTVTRLFARGITGLLVRGRPVFKSGTGSCTVNGGAFTYTHVSN